MLPVDSAHECTNLYTCLFSQTIPSPVFRTFQMLHANTTLCLCRQWCPRSRPNPTRLLRNHYRPHPRQERTYTTDTILLRIAVSLPSKVSVKIVVHNSKPSNTELSQSSVPSIVLLFPPVKPSLITAYVSSHLLHTPSRFATSKHISSMRYRRYT